MDGCNYEEMKVEETMIQETIPEETPLESDNVRTIGQEGSTYVNEFTVCILKYRGQTCDPSLENSVIHASSVEEFFDNVFHLVRPFIKRTIEFPTPNAPFWSEKEHPTREDLPIYVAFKDRIQKRSWRVDNIDKHMLLKWANRVLILQVYIYSMNIQCRPMWDLVTHVLLGNPINETAAIKKVTKGDEADKLETFVKKLKRMHQAYLVPKTRDAYKLWAQVIMSKPSRKQRDLCFNRPPKSMVENFTIIGKHASRRRVARRRNPCDDGFEFEDEVIALRQTVTQIKDLVDMLDRRVELLEDKCQRLRQTGQGVPSKRSRFNDEEEEEEENEDEGNQNGPGNEEPVIDEPSKEDKSLEGDSHGGNPDPLLFNDEIKFEYDEIEADD